MSSRHSPTHRAGVLRLVHVIPAVGLDVLRQAPALVLAQLLHGFRLHQHSVNGDGLLLQRSVTLEERRALQTTLTDLRTIKHIRGLLVEDDGLPVDVPGQDRGGEGRQHHEGAEVVDHGEEGGQM